MTWPLLSDRVQLLNPNSELHPHVGHRVSEGSRVAVMGWCPADGCYLGFSSLIVLVLRTRWTLLFS